MIPSLKAGQAGEDRVCLLWILDASINISMEPFRAFVGGPIAPGSQWVSWIHRADLIGLIEWSLMNDNIAGPINAVAPGVGITSKK